MWGVQQVNQKGQENSSQQSLDTGSHHRPQWVNQSPEVLCCEGTDIARIPVIALVTLPGGLWTERHIPSACVSLMNWNPFPQRKNRIWVRLPSPTPRSHPQGPLWCSTSIPAWEGAGPTEDLEQSPYRSELKAWGTVARLGKHLRHHQGENDLYLQSPHFPRPHQ